MPIQAAEKVPLLEMLLTPPLLYLFIIFFVFAVLGIIIRTPEFKGWFGEVQVNFLTRLFLSKQEYLLIRNVTLPAGGGTTQIDHVIVSRYGLFVVETKNMSGWIFGREREASWTQKFRGSSHKFQNPLRQNYKHTQTLAELLGLPAEAVKSVVVFIGSAKLKTETPPNVCVAAGYIRYIKSFRNPILTDEQVAQAVAGITQSRLAPTLATHHQHVAHVNTIVEAKQATPIRQGSAQPMAPQPVAPAAVAQPMPAAPPRAGVAGEPPACPTCGAPMVLRTSRKGPNAGGQFWGCSQFPKCRGIRQML